MDIFEFWSQIREGEKIHPADRDVLRRINPERHGFSTDCLPACYTGDLRNAPVVLLYLSPGFSEQDLIDAKSKTGKDYYFKRWKGNALLPQSGEAGYNWFKLRTKVFCSYDIASRKIAALNIGAYHSKSVRNYSSLLALPSSRASISWAQNILFPQAESGERIVICMRSATYWGLETGKKYGRHLYAPYVNMAGYLVKNKENEKIIKLVRKTLTGTNNA